MKKELKELMRWLRPYTPDKRLEMLLEAARIAGYKELEQAIIGYWSDKEYQVNENKFDQEHCSSCGIELDIDYEAMRNYVIEIDDLPPKYLILWCENCEKSFNGLGEEM